MQDKPQLEPASVVSILVSASFLKVLFNFLKRQYHDFFYENKFLGSLIGRLM